MGDTYTASKGNLGTYEGVGLSAFHDTDVTKDEHTYILYNLDGTFHF